VERGTRKGEREQRTRRTSEEGEKEKTRSSFKKKNKKRKKKKRKKKKRRFKSCVLWGDPKSLKASLFRLPVHQVCSGLGDGARRWRTIKEEEGKPFSNMPGCAVHM